jgi:3-dehydroshikimate dehydratase
MNQETLPQSLGAGLVSVTFRKLPPAEIVKLVQQARLDAIEWGGDVHVPPGDIPRAREVRKRTDDAGLKVAAYGSYYRAGVSEAQGPSFRSVLETARELGAPLIRVWAGNKASAGMSAPDRQIVIDDLHRIVDLAAAAGVNVATEYHGNTLTDSIDSARAMLDAVPKLKTLWQPPNNEPADHCLASLRSVLDRLTNVHVFQWEGANNTRHPLSNGRDRWRQYLEVLRKTDGRRYLLLEFVRDDAPERFIEDASMLKSWLAPA